MSEIKTSPEEVVKLFPHLQKHYDEKNIIYNIRNDISSFEDCRVKTPRIIRELIKSDPTQIQYIENPPYQLQKLAVELNGDCIQYVKQTITLCRLAVKVRPASIFYIKNQTPELCEQVIEYNPHFIKYIRNPSFELVKKAVSTFKGCITEVDLTNFTKEELEELKLLTI